MQKQFVTYEIALILKELGFNEECLGFYDNDVNLEGLFCLIDQDSNCEINTLPKNYDCLVADIPEKNCIILAPLWQQVIDWLFVNHEIIIARDFVGYRVICDRMRGLTYSNMLNPYSKEQAILKAIELIKENE